MSGYAIVGEWLVEETGECTCGTGGMDGYGHERGCGQEPIYKVAELLSNYRAQCARAERAEARVHAAEALPSHLADISRWITASYAPGMDPELVMRRRVGKIGNEYGELLDAIEGYTGENPRKGVYKTRDDVIDELLDCASSSLAAVEHMTGDRGDSLNRLAVRTEMQGERLRAALAQAALLMGGQSAEVRCRAALVALGCDRVNAEERARTLDDGTDAGGYIVPPELMRIALAAEAGHGYPSFNGYGSAAQAKLVAAESKFCPRDHGCSLTAGHDGDCELTAALCFCDECEAKL